MVRKIVDARILACPEPVMQTMKAMRECEEVVTIVDNEAARENVSQLAKSEGWGVSVERKDDGIYLFLKKGVYVTEEKKEPVRGVVLLIASEFFGRGEQVQLGSLLMQSFLHTLNGLLVTPETIIFVNSGVKLVTEGSLSLEDLRSLHGMRIEILACGTCLSHFGLMDKVAVGTVSNMMTIADTLLRAERVISI